MLTAKGDETDRVVGLELGADDYVAKPFSPRELLARLRAVLRRARPDVAGERLSVGDIGVDVPGRVVTLAGKPVDLTGIEFDVLVALVRRAGPRGRARRAARRRPAAATWWWASAPSTSTSPTCGRSSATTRARRASSRPSAASATSSPRTGTSTAPPSRMKPC